MSKVHVNRSRKYFAILLLFGCSVGVKAAQVQYSINATSDWFNSSRVYLTGSFTYDDTPGSETLTDLQLIQTVNIIETLPLHSAIYSAFTGNQLFSTLQGNGGPDLEFTNSEIFFGLGLSSTGTALYNAADFSSVPFPLAPSFDRGTWGVTNVGGNSYTINTQSDWFGPSSGGITGSFEYDSNLEVLSNVQIDIGLSFSEVLEIDPFFTTLFTPQELLGLLTGGTSSITNVLEFPGDTFFGGLVTDGTYRVVLPGSAGISTNTLYDQGTWSVSSSLNPIPIPATIWLFGTALIGLVGFSKRRKAA